MILDPMNALFKDDWLIHNDDTDRTWPAGRGTALASNNAIVQRDHHDEWTAMCEQRAPWDRFTANGPIN